MIRMRSANQGRWIGWLPTGTYVAAFLILLAIVGSGPAAASKRSPYAEFPLAKDVSGNGPYATLDEGQLPNKTRWGAWASRVGAGRAGFEHPCLSIARITRIGLYSDRHGCGMLDPMEKRPKPVYLSIAASYQTRPGGPFIGESVLALSFRPTVRSVVLKYMDGGQLQRRTQLFNSKQQKKTKLPPFRYVAIAMQKDVCVDTVIGYSKNGTELFSAETGLCTLEGLANEKSRSPMG